MVDPSAFFNAWEPQPSYTPAPGDAALAQRISKLALFAARNGPSFVELIKAKQAANPEYGFLHSGEGADFWRWSLFCALHGLPTGVLQARRVLQSCMAFASMLCFCSALERSIHEHLYGT